jgi:dGTPase
MKLSCPTLAAIAKYPRESWIPADILNGYTGKSVTKYGLFQSEKDVFANVAETVGLIRHHPEAAWWSRHPLAFLVEAADDICFHIMDLEDGYRMGYISFARTKELLNEIAQCETLNKDGKTESEQINLLRNLSC